MSQEAETHIACVRLGKRALEIRKAASSSGSGYMGYLELYLDGKYEGYIAVPQQGSPHIMIYGRSQVPKAPETQMTTHGEGPAALPNPADATGCKGTADTGTTMGMAHPITRIPRTLRAILGRLHGN